MAAWASGPEHVKSTVTFDFVFPAGTICDFDFHNVLTIVDNAIISPDGGMIEHLLTEATDTNNATGYTLTDIDHTTLFTAADGQTRFAGLFFHLRDASGTLVVVNAGQVVISPTGAVLMFTPHMSPSDAAVLCTALGGHPAS